MNLGDCVAVHAWRHITIAIMAATMANLHRLDWHYQWS